MTTPEAFAESICSLDDACEKRIQSARKSKKIVLTNGCFDLLHSGHIHALEQASKFGDELWVALNSDSSVRAIKGSNRPIYSQYERAYMLSSLRFVSLVFLFENGANHFLIH